MESDLGEVEATSHLAENFKNGKMVEKDEKESKRLLGVSVEGIDWQSVDRFEWGFNQRAKDSLYQRRECWWWSE